MLNIAYFFLSYSDYAISETHHPRNNLEMAISPKKHREGENITKYEEQSLIDLKVQFLSTLQNSPDEVEKWIKSEMTPEQRKKMR